MLRAFWRPQNHIAVVAGSALAALGSALRRSRQPGELHLSAVYRELGIRSRRELPAALA